MQQFLNFDEKGNLVPYGAVACSLDLFCSTFVPEHDSITRKNNFENYIRYSTDLKELTGGDDVKQWIDGSFATKKTNPNDIDIVSFLNQKQIKLLANNIDRFKGDKARSIYSVDAYIIEVYNQDSQYYSFTKGDIAYWYEQFVNTKPNRLGKKHKKGFIEIMF